jgi:catechol 2,3-dioxygenase-like lactoylglutathione lyase family enzyme
MGLSRYKVAPGVAVSDMDRARDFYEEKLGLSVGIDSGDNVQYRCGEGTMFHVYLSPEHAGNSTATLAGWGVEDIERVVDELASKGVVFERYDEEPIITNEKGIATFERDAKVVYFKDPDGNTPRSLKRRVPECTQTPSGVYETAYSPECVEGRFCELQA